MRDKVGNQLSSIDLAGYASVPEFIYGITREIWEDRGIGSKLEKYYAADILVRAPTGLTVGNFGVTAQTLQTLHQFPDRQLVGEDVIWTETPDRGFLSSHRLISVMTHTGDGVFGKAQGRPVRSYIIADCWVQDHQVKEEWLVRDQAALARCLGIEPRAMARDMTDRELRQGIPVSFFLPAHDRPSRYQPVIADDPEVVRYCAAVMRLWGSKEPSVIRELYFPGGILHVPGGETRHGTADIDRFFIAYLAAFPDGEFRIESATINRDRELPVRIALRWSLSATHSGFGQFGEPTGAPVYVMGMSHAYLTAGQVRIEWLIIDEISIWKQIFAHIESRSGA